MKQWKWNNMNWERRRFYLSKVYTGNSIRFPQLLHFPLTLKSLKTIFFFLSVQIITQKRILKDLHQEFRKRKFSHTVS